MAASTEVCPAATSATLGAAMVPRVVWTPRTRPPGSRANPVTSQCSTMSTPRRSAPVANPQATRSWRAMPPRRWSVAPRTGYLTSGETLTIGQNSATSAALSHSASTAFMALAFTRRSEERSSFRSCARLRTPRWLNSRSKPRSSSSPSQSFNECS